MKTISRYELETIKSNIKRIRAELKHLNPLVLSDSLLIENFKNKLSFHIKRLEPNHLEKKKLRLIKVD